MMKLNVFERSCVMTTAYRLGQTLAMHYVSSALFKAGWVVGSLELLGKTSLALLILASEIRIKMLSLD